MTPTAARSTTRTYGRVLVAGFRRQSTYRLAALGGLVANTTFGLLKVAVLYAAVRAAGGRLHGYDVGAMGAYVWLSQGMLGSVNLFGGTDLADRIKDGSVVVDFLRPLDVHAAAVTSELGRSLFTLLPRGVPLVLIGVVFADMDLPDSPLGYLLGAVGLLLGMVVSGATVYLVGATGFWLVETRGVQLFYMVLSGFLAGLFLPIALFPGWLRIVAEATPFPSMLMYPVDLLSGRVSGSAALGLVGLQLVWLAVTVAVGQAMTRAGRRRLEVQGG